MTSVFNPMQFETLVANIRTVLGAAATLNGFTVVGYQEQSINPEEVEGDNRSVRVYANEGNFPRSASSLQGPHKHAVTIMFECTVAEACEIDLDIINDPDATPAQKAAAILASKAAESKADASLDELFRNIFQILMDNRNLKFSVPTASNRAFESWRKNDEIENYGDLVVLTGRAQLSMQVTETVSGAVATPAAADAILIQYQTDGTGQAELSIKSED